MLVPRVATLCDVGVVAMLQAPRVFAKEWQAHSSPVVAIVSLTITTGILVNFSFQQLVVYDVCRVCHDAV